MPQKLDTTASKDNPVARWIKTVRAVHGLEQVELAQYIGKSRSSVAGYENGNPVPADTIALIRTSFPESPPPPVTSTAVEIAASLAVEATYPEILYAGVVPCSQDWGDPLTSKEARPIEAKFAGKNRFLCKVTGDSCYPALKQGDLTVWEKDREPPYGVIVLAERIGDQACTVKELQYDESARRARLVPVNPSHGEPEDGDGWECAARLVGVLRQGDGPERTWYWPPGLRARHLLAET
jgi:phage repressor protein C with HTH and peptisase S24 domain